jgi:hypothetical protein
VSLSNDDPVSQWNDLSGNGRHLVQSDNNRKPTFKTNVVNGLPGVQFDQDWMTVTFGSALSQPATIFMVARRNTTSIGVVAWMDGVASGARHYCGWPAQNTSGGLQIGEMFAGDSYASAESAFGTFSTTVPQVVTWIYNGSSSVFRKNGETIGTTGNVGTHQQGGITIGARFSLDQAWMVGTIFEIVGYSAVLSNEDRDAVEAYLLDKWTT